MRNQGQVRRFLHSIRRQQRAPCRTAGHDVAVISEDREPLRREGACAHMQGQRQQLAGDLVEIGHHQQEPLRRGEGRRQGTAEETAVHCSRHSAFGLHLHHARHLSPQVFPSARRPLVTRLGHGRRWRDRIDRDDFVESVGDGSDRLIGIARDEAGGVGRGGNRRGHDSSGWISCPHDAKKRRILLRTPCGSPRTSCGTRALAPGAGLRPS
mgnify:CR=1 FL=1